MKAPALLLTIVLYCAAKKSHHVDLSHRGLQTVPTNISPTTASLDLSWNCLQSIPNDSFVNLNSLASLDLSQNKLTRLEPSAFGGLLQLLFLNLGNNQLLLGYKSYPPTVFHPLEKLEILNMADNIPGQRLDHPFPNEIFSGLDSLKELSIDGPDDGSFGPGVMRMSQLKSLSVNFWESGGSLRLETFAYFSGLPIESLVLLCQGLEAETLRYFPFLTSLSLKTNGITKALSALADLTHHNLTYLTISGCNPGAGSLRDPENLILTRNNTVHLADICVRHLDLSDNALIHVGKDVLVGFRYPECVESFRANGNYLSIASNGLSLVSLARFARLEYLSVSPGREYTLGMTDFSSEQDMPEFPDGLAVQLTLPQSLRVLNASFLGGSVKGIPDLKFINAHHLQVLDLSYDNVDGCTFVMSGLENLKVLNISGFDCSFLSPKFFSHFTSLDVLVAQNCRLNTGLQQNSVAAIFKSQVNLRTLDLSSNNFVTLNLDIFKPLKSLENLILANNKLIHLPETIYELVSLKFLDLSSNIISSLSGKEIKWLASDLPLQTGGVGRVSFSHNPFICTCNTLDTMHWLLEGSAIVEELCSLKCTLQNGTVVKMCALQSQLKNMDVGCVSKFWLTFSIVGSCLITVVIVLGIFAYRYRWNIKYWVLTKFRRGPVYKELTNEQYKYDAFVAYNYTSYRWACIDLRKVLEVENDFSLCLHDRDFIPGGNIQQSIVDAMNNSRKIILVINKAFMKSEWCEFEVQMAGMRMVRDGLEDAIIVIMMEEIPVTEMSKSLLSLWKDITFLVWPEDDPGDERIFWSRLLDGMAR
ncbi:toll-like receptor 2 [Liolophura sinensis]|uniref:toll-like receptor 2 n=1 Tax=Liolophura sinensis TaxID=3198878 RepID=UPI003158FD99